MTKKEIFEFVNKLNSVDIPTMLYRETVFDVISFGKSSKIHLAATASIERIKRTLTEYTLEDVTDEKDTVKFVIGGDTVFIHSIFKISYEDFVEKMVATNLTFNSLLMKPNGQIFDMYGGLADLKEKRLSFVENFNKEPQNHLTLNCIRYIYKNNFSYDEQVGQYIGNTLPTFSKGEKTNALYYLAEFLLKNHNDSRLQLVLNNEFCKSDKYPDVEVGNFVEIIERIGVVHFIYILLLLLGINVNKSRFSNLLNTDEFNDVKNSFSLNLNDEITYYALKEEKGYSYLSTIVTLQKEFATITKTKYTEPIYHQKTIFDVLETNNTTATVNDEYLLTEQEPTEKIGLPKSDTFDFTNNMNGDSSANIDVIDFSHLFDASTDTDAAENCDTKETISEQDMDNYMEESVTTETEECIQNNDTEDKIMLKNDESAETDATNEKSECEAIVPTEIEEINETETLESDSATESEITAITPNDFANDNSQKDTEEDDIFALLNEDNEEKDVFVEKKRSVNPNFNRTTKKSEDVIQEDNAVQQESVPQQENGGQQAIAQTDMGMLAQTEQATDEFDFTAMFASDSPAQDNTADNNLSQQFDMQTPIPSVSELTEEKQLPVVEEKEEAPITFTFEVQQENSETPPLNSKENLINSIFEEEVKTPEVTLSPEFTTVMKQVENESRTLPQDTVVQRNTVTETLMTDVVPETTPTQQQSANFEISEKDLEAILEELNGRKKNSFLDDDSPSGDDDAFSASPVQGYEMPSQPAYQYNPNPTPVKTDDSDDFFKSLNDDFAEIVGGNQ